MDVTLPSGKQEVAPLVWSSRDEKFLIPGDGKLVSFIRNIIRLNESDHLCRTEEEGGNRQSRTRT